MFAGNVYGCSRSRQHATYRRHVYNGTSPALMQHLMDLLLHYDEEAFDVDLKDLVEISFRLLCKRPVRAGNTSIIECVIEPAENAHSFRDNLTHFFWYAKVRSKEECVSSFTFEFRFNQAAVLFISSHKDNFSASSRDAMNRGLSDSRCSTRDECNFTCQIHSVTSCMTWPRVRCGFFDQNGNLFRSGNVDGSLFPLLVARGKLP